MNCLNEIVAHKVALSVKRSRLFGTRQPRTATEHEIAHVPEHLE